MVPVVNNAVVAKALGRLTQVFKNKPVISAILSAYVAPFQDLETVLWAVIQAFILSNNPTGDVLDKIGARLGEPRNGRADAPYLAVLRVRILVNKSQGRAEDVLKVANAVSDATYSEPTGAVDAFVVEAYDVTGDVPTLLAMLAETRAAGSKGRVKYSTWPTSRNLVFSSRYGGASAATPLDSRRGGVTNPGLLVAEGTL